MKMLRGTARNLPSSLVWRVEDVHHDASGISHLLYSHNATLPYALLRSGTPNKGVFIHPSFFLELPVLFSPGDILRLTPEGDCLRLYEINSNDNALFVTDTCNSKCLMCPQPATKNNYSYRTEISDMLNLIDPSPLTLGITGGEPTLAYSDLLFFLQTIAEVHSACHIQLLTNGRALADYSKAKELHATHKNIMYCIPLYSDIADIHDKLVGVSGAFDETIEGIGNLLRLGSSIEIRMVVTAFNYHRLPQWSDFLYRNMPAIAHVAIMEMEPIGRAKINLDTLWIKPQTYAPQLFSAIRNFHRQGIPVSLYNYQLCLLPEPLRDFAVKSISGWKVRFAPECKNCLLKEGCGGFFFSSLANANIIVYPIPTNERQACNIHLLTKLLD